MDITNGDALRKWIEKAGNELGGLDILISNAGAMAIGADISSWEKNVNLDIFGAVHSTVLRGVDFCILSQIYLQLDQLNIFYKELFYKKEEGGNDYGTS